MELNKEPDGAAKPVFNETAEEKFNYESAFFYLTYLSDPFSILNDQRAMSEIKKIYFNSLFSNDRLAIMKSSFNYDFCRILCGLVEQAYINLENHLNLALTTGQNDQIFETCAICIGLVRNFSNYFRKFGEQAHEADFVKIAFRFMKNEKLIDAYTVHSDIKANRIVRPLVGALVNLSKLYSSYKGKWTAENSFETVFKLWENLKPEDDSKLATCIILANIADFNDTPEGFDQVISSLVEKMHEISKAVESKENLVRLRVISDIDECQIVARISTDSAIWHLIELTDALYHISCNVPLKRDIYRQMSLKSLILHGNATEVEYALKLLYQMCYNEEILEDIRSDEELIDKIKELANCYLDDLIKGVKVTDSLIKMSNGILWLLNIRPATPTSPDLTIPEEIKFIMLSYERESHDMCVKLKEAFEKENIKVWMDSGDLHESSLGLMARVVQNATCVVVCLTEKYKMNPFCRAEAHYALLNRKPVFTVIFEDNYFPNGWLGKYFGSKTPVNFSKSSDFPQSFNQLLSEIRKIPIEKKKQVAEENKSPKLDSVQKEAIVEKKEQKRIENFEIVPQNFQQEPTSFKRNSQSFPNLKKEENTSTKIVPRYLRPLSTERKEKIFEKKSRILSVPNEPEWREVNRWSLEPRLIKATDKENETGNQKLSSPESKEPKVEKTNGWPPEPKAFKPIENGNRFGTNQISSESKEPKVEKINGWAKEPKVEQPILYKIVEEENKAAQKKEPEIKKLEKIEEYLTNEPKQEDREVNNHISSEPNQKESAENNGITFEVAKSEPTPEQKIISNNNETISQSNNHESEKEKTDQLVKKDDDLKKEDKINETINEGSIIEIEEQKNKKIINNNVIKETKSESTETTPDLEYKNRLKSFNQPYDWSQDDVEKWLKDKHISPVIARNLLPCDGQILNQLYLIQSQAPDYFYKMINTNTNIPIREIAVFTLELKKIFQDN